MKIDIIAALKAKLKDKSDMPDWYYSRLSKCIGCEYNTGNIDNLSLKDRLRTSHNFGKDACVICTCGVEDKCSDEFESCPDTPSQWSSIRVKGDKSFYKIENHSPEKVVLTKENNYTLDYGNIIKGFDTKIEIFLDTKNTNLNKFSLKASCGCTKPTFKRKGEGYIIGISYDSTRMGYFSKNVTISYDERENGRIVAKKIPVTIKGDVKTKI